MCVSYWCNDHRKTTRKYKRAIRVFGWYFLDFILYHFSPFFFLSVSYSQSFTIENSYYINCIYCLCVEVYMYTHTAPTHTHTIQQDSLFRFECCVSAFCSCAPPGWWPESPLQTYRIVTKHNRDLPPSRWGATTPTAAARGRAATKSQKRGSIFRGHVITYTTCHAVFPLLHLLLFFFFFPYFPCALLFFSILSYCLSPMFLHFPYTFGDVLSLFFPQKDK